VLRQGAVKEFEPARLKAGEKKKMNAALTVPLILSNGTQKLNCKAMEFEKGELIGSEPGTAGSSKETLLFSGCIVEGNGEKCEVGAVGEEGKITTVRLENWLTKRKKNRPKENRT
jgi:hypothetical protein